MRQTQQVIITREPAHPDRTVAEVPVLTPSGVEAMLDGAVVARASWGRDAPLRARALNGWADAIEHDAEDLARLVTREVGKPITEARVEVLRGIGLLRYYAQAALSPVGEVLPNAGQTWLSSVRHPLGTALAITPWNFPVAIPLWKAAPALAAGNAVILKPSSLATGTATRLCRLSEEHLPRHVLSIAPVGAGVATELVKDSRVDVLTFTGSTTVGQQLIRAAADAGIPVQAEMAGQNPAIVLDDADLSLASTIIAGAAMGYAGQKCTATRRVLVHADVTDAFSTNLAAAVAALRVGDPMDEDVDLGPVITQAARDDVATAVAEALGRGAIALNDPEVPDGPGWFVAPQLLRLERAADPIAQSEVFGPVAVVVSFEDDDQAVEIANATRFGLSAAVYGENLNRAWTVAERLRAGMIRVNGPTTGVDYWAPFGGERDSSYGPREQGADAPRFFTSSRTLTVSRR